MTTSDGQHRLCYANALGGCTSTISREHYFSKALLEQIHAYPIVEGLPGQAAPETRYSIASLTAKILCTHHNALLSPLDAEAAKVFELIDRFEQESATKQPVRAGASTIVSGRLFERWLLKVAFGLCKGKIANNSARGVRTTSLRDEDALLRVLFEQTNWRENWGLYLAMPDRPVGAPASLGFEPRSHPQTNELMMLVAWLRVVEFWLCLGKPDGVGERQYRPGAIEFRETRSQRRARLTFTWPAGAPHQVFKMERIGEQDGWATR
jgi:hypothetical protein